MHTKLYVQKLYATYWTYIYLEFVDKLLLYVMNQNNNSLHWKVEDWYMYAQVNEFQIHKRQYIDLQTSKNSILHEL